MKTNLAKGIATDLWEHFNNREWDKARALLSDDFEAHWPQSREIIKGPENFIQINREYPGSGTIQVQDATHFHEPWEHTDCVTTQTKIDWKKPDGKEETVFAISFFEIQEDLIIGVTEYWAETYAAPEWRKHLVEAE